MFKITIYVRPRDGFKFKEWFEEEELQDVLSVYLDFDEDCENEEDSKVYVLSGMYDEVPIEDIIDLLGEDSDLVIEWYSSEVPIEKIEDPSTIGTVENGNLIVVYGDSCGRCSYIKTEPLCFITDYNIMTPDEFFDRDPAFW